MPRKQKISSDRANRKYESARHSHRTRPPGPHDTVNGWPPSRVSQETGRLILGRWPASTWIFSTPFSARLIRDAPVGNSRRFSTRCMYCTAANFPEMVLAWLPCDDRDHATKATNWSTWSDSSSAVAKNRSRPVNPRNVLQDRQPDA